MQVPDLLLHIETCCMTILAKAAHTAAKAEVCELHDMCPLGLRNELNVKESESGQASARITGCKVWVTGLGMCSSCGLWCSGGAADCGDVRLHLC